MAKDFEKLVVWQRAHELVLEIYKETVSFPAEERYGLTSQIRRSAASIATNVAEGQGSHSKKIFGNLLYMARGSLIETRYHLRLAHDLGYLSTAKYDWYVARYEDVGKMLNALINSLKNDKDE